jgi:immune inhibitor A
LTTRLPRGSRSVRRSAAFLFLGLVVVLGAASCRGGSHETTPTPGAATAVVPTPTSVPALALETDDLPSRDLLDLAHRLSGLKEAPADPVNPLPQSLSVGDHHLFQLVMMADPGAAADQPPHAIDVWATLRAVTPHGYFYVQDDESVSQEEIDQAAQRFEDEVYPTVTAAMGRERSPGVDNDVHVTVFNGPLQGAAGYFSDMDGYPKALAPLSNEREMVYLDLSLVMGSDAYSSVLAHELQHLIHTDGNPREDVWINEGVSVVAQTLVGQKADYSSSFLPEPDTQLTQWEANGDNYAHYGAAGLFFHYLALRSGGVNALHDVVFESGKGISGVDNFLLLHGGLTFDDLFADWTVANYTGGPADYLTGDERAATAAVLDEAKSAQATVHQFAADYIEVDLPGRSGTLAFDGAEAVPILADEAHSGSGQWWSGRGDDIDTTLTREIDLENVDSATLRFWTWFDIERWYDYGYVEVSTDDGATWQILRGNESTDDDPVKQAYGPGYTGQSGDGSTPAWVEESIDLTPFADQKVLLRFEYVTDGGLSTSGWAIDDVSVPEIGLSDDAESDGGWDAHGFQRITQPIGQQFIVQVIDVSNGSQVQRVALDAANDATIQLPAPSQGTTEYVIVVAATSEGTSEEAQYTYSLSLTP